MAPPPPPSLFTAGPIFWSLSRFIRNSAFPFSQSRRRIVSSYRSYSIIRHALRDGIATYEIKHKGRHTAVMIYFGPLYGSQIDTLAVF